MDLSWGPILNLPIIPGLVGGFVGSFLVLVAGYFVDTGFEESSSKWNWSKKAQFLIAGTLLGTLLSLYIVAVEDAGTLDLENSQADWSKLLY